MKTGLKCLKVANLLIAGSLLISCGSGSKKPANSFQVFDLDGKSHSSADWIGRQPVVINFWGTWCGPCRREMPDLVRLYKEYAPRGVEILGLAIRDNPTRIRQFTSQYGVDWVMLMADANVVMRFGATQGVPTTIFLDRDGNELMRYVGVKPYEMLKRGFEAIVGN